MSREVIQCWLFPTMFLKKFCLLSWKGNNLEPRCGWGLCFFVSSCLPFSVTSQHLFVCVDIQKESKTCVCIHWHNIYRSCSDFLHDPTVTSIPEGSTWFCTRPYGRRNCGLSGSGQDSVAGHLVMLGQHVLLPDGLAFKKKVGEVFLDQSTRLKTQKTRLLLHVLILENLKCPKQIPSGKPPWIPKKTYYYIYIYIHDFPVNKYVTFHFPSVCLPKASKGKKKIGPLVPAAVDLEPGAPAVEALHNLVAAKLVSFRSLKIGDLHWKCKINS